MSSQPTDFIVLTCGENNRLDAAAHFRAEPRKAFQTGKEMAIHAGCEKFRIFAISMTAEGDLRFERVPS